MKRGEIWWADLGAYRAGEQTGRSTSRHRLAKRHLDPAVPIRSDCSLTTNLDRAQLAGTALISATDGGLPADSVALAFQMRAIPKACLKTRIRSLSVDELAELDLATDEAVGRVEPETPE